MRKDSRVIIVGAGFGGMQAAFSLAKTSANILLIDRNNFHTFVPLLYQVATAQIEAEKIAYPIRTLFRKAKNVSFLKDEVNGINFADRSIETTSGLYHYDFLVLATGSQSQFHRVPGADTYAWSMRTLPEAIALRNHLMECFEQASQEYDMDRLRRLLTFVIVGGGATGVEMAGALIELIQGPIKRDYPSVDLKHVKILLIQSGNVLLPDLPPRLGMYTAKKLRTLGVTVCLNARVSHVQENGVAPQNGECIESDTVIWVTGMQASVPKASQDIAASAKGKLVVRPTLQLQDYPDVYAIGDVAHVEKKNYSLAGVAPEALQQGVFVARNIKRQLRSRRPLSFTYLNKGRLAIIGCFSGVGKIGPFTLSGFLAWFMWLAVHLVYLPGFRNRLLILISWLHTYFSRDRVVRQIIPTAESGTKSDRKSEEVPSLLPDSSTRCA